MRNGQTESCGRTKSPRQQWRVVLAAALGLSLVVTALTSCKKAPPRSQNAGQQASGAAIAEPSSIEQGGNISCRDFVQDFYNWYVSRDVLDEKSPTGKPTSDDVLRLRPQVLSAELGKLLKSDSDAQAKAHEIVGLDFDPFFNSQDPSPEFRVKAVEIANGRCTATVNGIREGSFQETVMPELVSKNGKWVFVNFHYRYDSGDSDLIQQLNLLAAARVKHRE